MDKITTYLARINITKEDFNKFKYLKIEDNLKVTYEGESVWIEPKNDIGRFNRFLTLLNHYNIKYIREYEYTE